MVNILALYGSPRRSGNTATLLSQCVKGAREQGAEVQEVVLRDANISPCLEIYGCREQGRCVINDNFQNLYDMILASQGIILASPIFFYTVSAHTKILMDRCQSLWVKKYLIDKVSFKEQNRTRKGLFISVGATKGKKLFDGVLLTVRYFFDAIDTELWRSLLYRNLDSANDVLKYPEYIEDAYRAGTDLVEALVREKK